MIRSTRLSARRSSALLCAILLSLLSACGGSQPPSLEERSATGVEASSSESAPHSEDAALARAAALNTTSLAAAEQRAQAAETDAASTDLDTLSPGQPAPKSAYASDAVARKALAVAITAYRFYNTRSGAHFYTVSQAERDHVRTNLSPPFTYEGEAYRVASAYAPGLSPVHRFFNTRNGVHFYTISEAERAHVAANLRHYTYEGVAYHASEVAGGQLLPFHRFYVPSKGFHFYTASEAEKNHIIANLGATYRYEGVGYYVLDAQWNAEKLPHTGTPSSACYRAGSDALQDCFSDETSSLNFLQDGSIGSLGLSRLDYEGMPRPSGDGLFPLNECVVDKVTGLVWEGKNPNPDQPRYGGASFTNLGNGLANDASGHVASVNASRLCGYSDWRLPSRMELQSIVHYGVRNSAIDARFVNSSFASSHWTSEVESNSPNRAWYVLLGESFAAARSTTYLVRLVRGTPLGSSASRFSVTTIAYSGDAANNVVNDNWTGLQWRRCEEGRNWNGTTCAGNPLSTGHENALMQTKQKAGWRMPNIKELASLFDLSHRRGNQIDQVAFPGAGASLLWSTTPSLIVSNYSWLVNINSGEISSAPRATALGVRLLRANY